MPRPHLSRKRDQEKKKRLYGQVGYPTWAVYLTYSWPLTFMLTGKSVKGLSSNGRTLMPLQDRLSTLNRSLLGLMF